MVSNSPKSTILKRLYENFWVPYFGRILMLFASWIEGESVDKSEPSNRQ